LEGVPKVVENDEVIGTTSFRNYFRAYRTDPAFWLAILFPILVAGAIVILARRVM
jgi:hypothetical protein